MHVWAICVDHVMQAETSADLDVLAGDGGAETPRKSH